jgi:hypothetical protein
MNRNRRFFADDNAMINKIFDEVPDRCAKRFLSFMQEANEAGIKLNRLDLVELVAETSIKMFKDAYSFAHDRNTQLEELTNNNIDHLLMMISKVIETKILSGSI